MSQDKILANGGQFFSDFNFTDFSTMNNIFNHWLNLPSRPDWDGMVTLSEANEWYRENGGAPLFVNIKSIDFSTTYRRDVLSNNGYVNLFLKQTPLSMIMNGGGRVYGTVKLQLVHGRTVTVPKGYFDRYDFDQKPWGLNPLRWARNIGTYIGEWKAGSGTPFNINLYGTANLGIPLPIK